MDDERKRKFRSAIAGLLRGLIDARLKQEPDFLSTDDYAHWRMGDFGNQVQGVPFLLTSVKQLHEKFVETFYGFPESIPAPTDAQQADAVDGLYDLMSGFITGDLDDAIRVAARGEPVDWTELAAWNSLGLIRELLDQLPEPQGTGGIMAAKDEANTESVALPPELTDLDVRILQCLAERLGLVKFQEEITAAVDCDRKTVGSRLTHLREIGYVQRPAGKKQGDVITDSGVARLKRMNLLPTPLPNG